MVHGGQQPVSGASIQLYAAGTSGDGSAATPLLTTAVTSDASGGFSITGDYTCPAGSDVYLVATGGNPGLANGTNNTSIAMMAALGHCSSLSSTTFISVNELTTIGSLAALYPYTTGYANIGYGISTDSANFNIAATETVTQYTNVSNGTVPGPGLNIYSLGGNAYASSTEIDTLADVLATCINSPGGVAGDGSACGNLFSLTTPPSGTAPTDTVGAILNILLHPTLNVSGIYALTPAAGPFQPTLTAVPTDWTLPILQIPPAPGFSLMSGTYFGIQILSIYTNAFPSPTVYYTVDGSTPTTSSQVNTSGTLHIPSSETVKAISSVGGGRAFSPVGSVTLVIIPTPLSFSSTSGSNQMAQVGTAFALPLQVTAHDSSGNPVVGFPVTFTASSGGVPSATFSSCTTDLTGTCAVTATANSITGTFTAYALLQNAQASFNLTNVPAPSVSPASIHITAGSGQSALVGAAFPTAIKVTVADSASNPVSGALVAFAGPGSGAGATFSPLSCTTDTTGSCTSVATANLSAGTYIATASTGALSAGITLTNTPGPVNTGPRAYSVAVTSDTTTGTATNCIDQNSGSTGSNANCSLRDALAAASANATAARPAVISFAATAASTVTLANGTLNIPSNTTIQGATAGNGTTLTNLITVDGNNTSGVFSVASGVTNAVVNNLTITHGNANGVGFASVGGGIYTSGSLSVNSCTFSSNNATASGGALSNNGGTLTVSASTFVNNSAVQGYGGGIDNFGGGTLTVSNSTFATNNGWLDGGAIYSSGTATVTDSTIVGNTSPFGGGVYNKGTMSVTNSIVNSNTNEDCGGLYCAPLWAYVAFTSATPSVTDAANITIAFSDSLGNTFSQTVAYGQFSTPASLTATFGPYFSQNTSGLDTTPIGAQGIGNLLVISPANGATLRPLTITNPGASFLATQATYPFLLSGNNNVYGVTAAQVNLSPLGNNGGPTQTMVPLAGSTALCVISQSNATGTDQRGQPRTATVGTNTCQDAGAVQTSN